MCDADMGSVQCAKARGPSVNEAGDPWILPGSRPAPAVPRDQMPNSKCVLSGGRLARRLAYTLLAGKRLLVLTLGTEASGG